MVRRPGISGPRPLLTAVASLQTHCEDVGVVGQGEMHTTDEEGQGGQVLDVVTVHGKLQRGTRPQVLHCPPERTCQPPPFSALDPAGALLGPTVQLV